MGYKVKKKKNMSSGKRVEAGGVKRGGRLGTETKK